MKLKPAYQSRDGRVTLYFADAIDALAALPPRSIDQMLTDPPYSSGGLFKGDRGRDPITKYLTLSSKPRRVHRSFGGDTRDQRSYGLWCHYWLTMARAALRPDGYAHVFTDWRQLSTITDVMQSAGIVQRGTVAWDKGRGSRVPHTGYHRHQAEFIPWGTNGRCLKAPGFGPFDGVIRAPIRPSEKEHPTGKPVELMEQLVTVPAGSAVLDPFMGSGSTGVAALRRGCRFVGVEADPHWFEVAKQRLTREARATAKAAAAAA